MRTLAAIALTLLLTPVLRGGQSAVAKEAEGTRTSVFVSGTDSTGGSTAAETTGLLVKACPELIVTLDRDKADYILVRDNTGAGPGRKPQKLTIFNHAHELIYVGATRSVGGAAKDACRAILGKKEKKN